MKKRDCTICVAKTKVLISCAVTAQLICTFGFAYADCWFSYATARIYPVNLLAVTAQLSSPLPFCYSDITDPLFHDSIPLCKAVHTCLL